MVITMRAEDLSTSCFVSESAKLLAERFTCWKIMSKEDAKELD